MADSEPKRIQRKRTKGWKMPPNTVYVGRPTKWGNPFKVWDGKTGFPSQEHGSMSFIAVDNFRRWLEEPEQDDLYVQIKGELRGKDLACWCRLDRLCHADALLEIANG